MDGFIPSSLVIDLVDGDIPATTSDKDDGTLKKEATR